MEAANFMWLLMEIPDWVPFVAGAVVLIGIIVGISAWFAKKRTQALTAVSLEIGFLFVGHDWKTVQQAPALQTELFNKGHSKRFRNIMTGSVAGMRANLFDYAFTVGGGRSSHTYNQTVGAYCKSGVNLPSFSLRPQGMMHKLWDAVVHKDITFDSNPEFASRYVLRGPESERIRILFTPSLMSYLQGLNPEKKWQLEGMGDTLLVYRGGKKANPGDFRAFLGETSTIAGQFFSLGNWK
jgi:hypothetical protein